MNTIIEKLSKEPYLELPGNFQGKELLLNSLKAFMERPLDYRLRFAQSAYGLEMVGFDGYSYPGQLDSVNQAYDDHLHSMVFSEFLPPEAYPKEFWEYLKSDFKTTLDSIKEKMDWVSLTEELDLKDKLGFSASINFYPKMTTEHETNEPRLTEHIDGSLFTIFPYGLDEGLMYERKGEWKEWPATSQALCFPGYLHDILDSPLAPLNHKLEWENPEKDRYAFAFFVVPKPGVVFQDKHGSLLTTANYYHQYLALFD